MNKQFIIILSFTIINCIELNIIKSKKNYNSNNFRFLNKNYTIQSNKYKNNFYHINIFMGIPPQEFNLIIDTGSNDFWVYDIDCKECLFNNSFKKNNSITFQNTEKNKQLNYFSGTINGMICSDTLKLKDIILNNFHFLLVNESYINIRIDGIIGFNRKNENESFIEQLFNNKMIDKKIFVTDFYNNKIYISEIPKYLIGNDNITINYNRNNNTKDWTIPIDNIIINNTIFHLNENDKNIIIDSGNNGLIIPFKYYEFFKENLFQQLLNKKICSLEQISLSLLYLEFQIQCNNNILNEELFLLNNITFTIESNLFNISLISLFNKDEFTFNINFIQTILFEKWIFGIQLLETHPIIFDKDNNNLIIYKRNIKIINDKNKGKIERIIKISILILIFILILLIILIICYLIYQNKHKITITKNIIEDKIANYNTLN